MPRKRLPSKASSDELVAFVNASRDIFVRRRSTSGGGRCAHRLSVLHTGWIQGERIRCMYHGWQFDGSGQCTERPAEGDTRVPDIKIAGYPLHEYAGALFAYMGDGPAP